MERIWSKSYRKGKGYGYCKKHKGQREGRSTSDNCRYEHTNLYLYPKYHKCVLIIYSYADEGKETDDFWKAIGGKGPVASAASAGDDKESEQAIRQYIHLHKVYLFVFVRTTHE